MDSDHYDFEEVVLSGKSAAKEVDLNQGMNKCIFFIYKFN
jgi:hypothetical protein